MLDTRFFPPDYRGKYPHMFPRDVGVWERFLDRYGNLYQGFYYDVLCGNHTEINREHEMIYQADAYILSKLRIDAVGIRDDSIDLIEVKPRGNAGSLGQLMTYKEHYIKEYQPDKHVRMVLVAGEIDPNIIPLAEKEGIVYIVV